MQIFRFSSTTGWLCWPSLTPGSSLVIRESFRRWLRTELESRLWMTELSRPGLLSVLKELKVGWPVLPGKNRVRARVWGWPAVSPGKHFRLVLLENISFALRENI